MPFRLFLVVTRLGGIRGARLFFLLLCICRFCCSLVLSLVLSPSVVFFFVVTFQIEAEGGPGQLRVSVFPQFLETPIFFGPFFRCPPPLTLVTFFFSVLCFPCSYFLPLVLVRDNITRPSHLTPPLPPRLLPTLACHFLFPSCLTASFLSICCLRIVSGARVVFLACLVRSSDKLLAFGLLAPNSPVLPSLCHFCWLPGLAQHQKRPRLLPGRAFPEQKQLNQADSADDQTARATKERAKRGPFQGLSVDIEKFIKRQERPSLPPGR